MHAQRIRTLHFVSSTRFGFLKLPSGFPFKVCSVTVSLRRFSDHQRQRWRLHRRSRTSLSRHPSSGCLLAARAAWARRPRGALVPLSIFYRSHTHQFFARDPACRCARVCAAHLHGSRTQPQRCLQPAVLKGPFTREWLYKSLRDGTCPFPPDRAPLHADLRNSRKWIPSLRSPRSSLRKAATPAPPPLAT